MFGRKKKVAARDVMRNSEISAPDGIELLDSAAMSLESEAIATVTGLFDVYRPGVVFSEPTTVNDHTVITASEVYVGMGLGVGRGSGESKEDGEGGEGSGFGGGGGSAGRPVAAVIIGPSGVRVEPIVDVTKIALAFFTTIGAMFMAWRAMRRQK